MRIEQPAVAKPGRASGDHQPSTTPVGAAASKSKRELYQEAKKAGIVGRSAMSKQQLIEALRRHEETGQQRASATLTENDSARGACPPAAARRPDRCAIAYQGSGRHGEFQVVVTEADRSPKSVSRSPAFRVPKVGGVRRRGAARAAHDLLVRRLEAAGWWPAGSGEAWYELGFVRLRTAGMGNAHSLVTVVRDGRQARFLAEELETYGNPTPLVVSVPFNAPRSRAVPRSPQAKAALKELVMRMRAHGWKVAAPVGEKWHAISLSRRSDGSGALAPSAQTADAVAARHMKRSE
jgi:hypothetical protein